MRGALPGSDVRRSGRKRKVGECVVTECPWGVSRQRDEVRAMWPTEPLPAALALARIHDVVRCSIVRTFLAQEEYCDVPRDYSAARETHSDCLGFAAGFWLSMGTSND